MARSQSLFVSQLFRIVMFILIIITILSYVYDNIFIVAHMNDDNIERSKFEQIEITNDNHLQTTTTDHNTKQSIYMKYSIPSLIIIGPPKAGTTSLIVNLAKYFPNWYHQIPAKENGHWYGALRMKIIKNNSLYSLIMNQLQSEINNIEISNKQIKISNYPFNDLLTDSIWPHSKILIKKNEYITTILTWKKTDITLSNDTIIMEKTPFNFYLPHLALVFLKYFSSTNFGTSLINNQLYHHSIGTKLIGILRDPTKRLISWHSMKQKWSPSRHSMDYFILNDTIGHKFVLNFRDMIINRENQYDDTLIMLKYIKWIYEIGHNNKGPWANIWLTEYMLMCGMDYPVFLIWIYAYKQMELNKHFKVIGFNYMINHFEEVMIWIRCWVEHDITDVNQCNHMAKYKYVDINEQIVFEHMNKYAKPKSDSVVQYMNWFYKPLKYKTALLLQKTDSIIGVWNNSDVMTSW
eukprot:449500_1